MSPIPFVPSAVVAAFLMGIFGSTHCVAMCGGVVSVLCSSTPRCGSVAAGSARPTASVSRSDTTSGSPNEGRTVGPSGASYWLAYNAGRVASYTLLGGIFGTLGTLSTGLFPLDAMRFALRGLAAVCMLAAGLHLAGFPSPVKRLEAIGVPIWRHLMPLTRRYLPLRSPLHALALGSIWGLMPCGLLYGALALAASTESPSTGAATMTAFALGTLPVVIAMSALADGVKRAMSRAWLRRAAGLVVLAFGMWSAAGLVVQVGVGDPGHTCCPHR